ncbi:YjbE family putative metal transport protein [Pectinatus sottacetonis]|uniref:YjbE family putative metal transport protein n=1 Tax=Pectinatus sottacetonis TaxID=1002795 RepID=UPI0018C76409|nr:YjbE family putative metal transport protein [Pectinatus sottacetonis]
MDFATSLGTIILLDLILAGDNAVVIALASRRLPDSMRKRAIFIGMAGAVVIRILMTFLATYLLTIPYLQAAGGLLLLPIAIKLLRPTANNVQSISSSVTFMAAVRTIIIADAAMGIDNVLAIAGAAQGNFWLIIIGLIISIPIIISGSNFIAACMNRLPFLVTIGACILAYTSASMINNDLIIGNGLLALNQYMPYLLPIIFVLITLISSYVLKKST